MRGADVMQDTLFATRSLDSYVPKKHPLRRIQELLNRALTRLDSTFEQMYADGGRESIPPERLLRALALQALYSVRSERLLCEQLEYNMLFRWFVGLSMDSEPWDHSTFSKNRDRLIDDDVVRKLFVQVLEEARLKQLLSKDHFSVDGTMIRAWASHKSFVAKNGRKPPKSGPPSNPDVDFRGTTRSRDTHESTSDPEALLYRKSPGQAAVPSYLGHALMENRSGLAVDCRLTQAEGTAERDAALEMLDGVSGKGYRITVAGDKGFDQAAFVDACRERGITPHVAQNTSNRRSRIDGRTTRHAGYAASQIKRKLIETLFADVKQHGSMRQVKLRGVERVDMAFTISIMVANLRRMARLMFSPIAASTG